MKKVKLALGLMILPFIGVSQSTTATNNQNIGQTRYLGFDNNFPLRTVTAGVNRTKLNGNVNYTVNGYADVRNGYMLIGATGNSITDNQNIYSQKGAFSLLHLNGTTASNAYQEYGYRPWMKTGITLTGNRDLSYFGLRALGTGEDITETTLAWSDNAGQSNPGPDDMVFRFISGGGSTLILWWQMEKLFQQKK